MIKWRGKIRYGMCIVLLLLVMLVATTYISNRITENDIITQQMAMIGKVYKENPVLCEEVLLALFQETDEDDVMLADEALSSLGCTSEGIVNLYMQSTHKNNADMILIVQIGIACMILFCVERFMRKQEKQVENQVDLAVAVAVEQSEKECIVARDTAQKFVENIAHQIKTPLACVSLSLDLIQETLQDGAQKEQLKDAFGYLKQIEVLMKRLLDIGRLESGKQMMRKEEISLEEILYSCTKLLDIKDEQLVVDIINETDAVPVFYGDYDWLRECFCNIFKNALEHTPLHSNITVTLRYEKELIFIQIKDQGEGIPQEDIKHIFDRFYIPNHAKKGHTGIGLNLARLVVEKHFGTIEAINCETGGTQISMCFPLYGFKNQKM